MVGELRQQISKLEEQLRRNDEKWQEQIRFERRCTEKERINDVQRVQDKYETLIQEFRARMERAESDLRTEREKWLGMFKDLYQLSKTGELAKMKATLEETLSE